MDGSQDHISHLEQLTEQKRIQNTQYHGYRDALIILVTDQAKVKKQEKSLFYTFVGPAFALEFTLHFAPSSGR